MLRRARAACRVVVSAALVTSAFALTACGAGGGGDGAYTTITVDNDATSEDSITQVTFDFFDLSGIGDRVESVFLAPGEGGTFEFTQFQSESLLSMTVRWSDLDETFIPLLGVVSGGDFSYPLLH